ncbi:MAG TPA: DUF3460 family protein [Casimicrobiaceae bacterium]|nr:DUF3460 family protein [Casimicrobiaceae bacterium]
MGMLPARDYVSEHTTFIRDLLAKKPAIVDDQREGRAIWWDKTPRELASQRVMDKNRVRQKPYVYYMVDGPTSPVAGSVDPKTK